MINLYNFHREWVIDEFNLHGVTFLHWVYPGRQGQRQVERFDCDNWNYNGYILMQQLEVEAIPRYVVLPIGRGRKNLFIRAVILVLYYIDQDPTWLRIYGQQYNQPSYRARPHVLIAAVNDVIDRGLLDTRRGMQHCGNRDYRDVTLIEPWHHLYPMEAEEYTFNSLWNLNYQLDIEGMFGPGPKNQIAFRKLIHLIVNVINSIHVNIMRAEEEAPSIRFIFYDAEEGYNPFQTAWIIYDRYIFEYFFMILENHLYNPDSDARFSFTWGDVHVEYRSLNIVPMAGEIKMVAKYFRNMFLSPYQFVKNKYKLTRFRLKKLQFNPIIPHTKKNCIFSCIIIMRKFEKKDKAFLLKLNKSDKKVLSCIHAGASILKKQIRLLYSKKYDLFSDEKIEFFDHYYSIFKNNLDSFFFNLAIFLKREIIVWSETLDPSQTKRYYNVPVNNNELLLPDLYLRRKPKKEINLWIVAGHAILLIPGLCDLDEFIFDVTFKSAKIKDKTDKKYQIYCKNVTREKKLIFFDYETLALNKPLPYALGWVISNEKKFFSSFGPKCTIKFLNFLTFLYSDEYVLIAHNGGRFDFLFLLQVLMRNKSFYVKKIIEQHGRITYISFTHVTKTRKINFTCLDSYCFLPFSLKVIGESFQLKVQKGDIDHDKMRSYEIVEDYKEEILKYLEKDCRVLKQAVLAFHEVLFQRFAIVFYNFISISSISKFIFKNKFYQPDKFPIYRLSILQDKFFRENTFYGGRTECFYQGIIKHGVWYYDFTSLYPFCLLKKLPYGLPTEYNCLSELSRKRFQYDEDDKKLFSSIVLNKENFGWYTVQVKSHSYNWKPLHCQRINNRLFFPHYKKWTELVIFSEELRLSLQLKLDYEYKFVKFYKFKCANYYKTFIEYLYELKKHGTLTNHAVLRLVGKLLINCAYGFWGLKFFDVSQVDISRSKIDKTFQYLNNFSLMDINKIGKYTLYRYKGFLKSDTINIPIASATTAYARIELYKLFYRIEQRKGTIYYCDTDSIITNYCIEKDEALVDLYMKNKGLVMGELKNEFEYGKYYKSCIILGLKMYVLRKPDNSIETKLKGLKKCLFVRKFLDFQKRKIYCFSTLPEKFDHYIQQKEWKEFKGEDAKRIVYQDYELLSEGWSLILFTSKFFASASQLFKKDFAQIEKVYAQKIKFKKLYSKGIVEKSKYISPYIL